ncbi:MAG: rod shape-determining protein MreC [Lachnospiraceae bacterium]|nr:rod shape-determining protein MreC [Lachnospiraceae bacterium]MBQ2106509.1 rod shape-determining protein MreC [Lachnospiraceae bacterium]MBQ2251309.1 rod shape-determining protein MreC [Lachnospiraceae bacterium]MBQ2402280.1 rod shape-determining protein MreC [Lachnospiraceae bacterium]MBQ2404390.1 rod shape-determining protein MreC [Lachnospiraceae bacterium]
MTMKNTRYFLIGLSIFCICMIGITSLKGSLLNPLRSAVGYVLVPIQSGVNAVGGSIYEEATNIRELKTALEENERLQARVDELTEENTRLRAEQLELERLRNLYELDTQYMQYNKVGARIIAKDTGSWFSVFRIDKGSADGIKENMNVIAGGGLVGIITDVGANYATVRSIIDDSSEVSAMAQQSGDTCIVSGDLKLFNEGRLNLGYMEKDDDIKDGDMIVTSNISGKFLPGILIGYATDITVDYSDNLTKSGYVIPVAQFDRLQEVLVITDLKDAGPEIHE